MRRLQRNSESDVSYSDDSEYAHRDSRTRSFFAAAILCIVTLIGSTFAIDISLNSKREVEFGQGIALTTACSGDREIRIIPRSTFVNTSGGGVNKISTLKILDIPASCQNSMFILKFYGTSSNSSPLPIGRLDTCVNPLVDEGSYYEIKFFPDSGIGVGYSNCSVATLNRTSVYDHLGVEIALNMGTFLNTSIYHFKSSAGTYLTCKITDQANYVDLLTSAELGRITLESMPFDTKIKSWYDLGIQEYC